MTKENTTRIPVAGWQDSQGNSVVTQYREVPANCANCRWWSRYTNELRDHAGTCSVPLPPIASGGEGAYLYRNPSRPDYWCVLWSGQSA